MKKYFQIITVLLIASVSCIYSQSNRKADSLLHLYKNEKNDTVRLKLLLKVFNSFKNKNPDTAVFFAKKALAEIAGKPIKNEYAFFKTKCTVDLYNGLGILYESKTDFNTSLEYYLKAKKVSEENNYKPGLASSHQNISVAYIQKGNYDMALKYIDTALEAAKETGNKKSMSGMYTNKGLIYRRKGDLVKAVESYLEGLKISQELKDSLKMLGNYNNLGQIYLLKRDFKNARKYFETALKIVEPLKRPEYLAVVMTSLGQLNGDIKNYNEELRWYSQALKISEGLNDPGGMRDGYGNVGNACYHLSKFREALEYHIKSLNISVQYGDSVGIAETNNLLGADYAQQKDFIKSARHYLYALSLAQRLGEITTSQYSCEGLADCYTRAGDYKKALEYRNQYYKLNDSLLNAKNFEAIANMRANFELEQKDKERALILRAKEIEQKAALDKQKTINFFLAAGGVILLLFAAVVVRAYLNKKKANVVISSQKEKVEFQKNIIEEKNREIIDSINYAERIQRSFLATKDLLDHNLRDYFVFFKPKDIVSGDFYWAAQLSNGNFAYVAADSTGHGVPGAIMSILNISSLELAIREGKNKPSDILNYARTEIINRLKNDGSKEGGKDGMDASLVVLDKKRNRLTYAAANNPVWIVRGSELIELNPDKMPVGKHDKDQVPFTELDFELQTGDTIYSLTDGMPDQFGGPKGKKYKYSQLKEFLISISSLPVQIQKEKLKEEFIRWKGNLEQIDDVTIIGIKI